MQTKLMKEPTEDLLGGLTLTFFIEYKTNLRHVQSFHLAKLTCKHKEEKVNSVVDPD
jgi:hypothetical protein